ncbi:MAG TPA: hypothetical protein PKN90_05560 [Paludibacteraceae bacterium]|nr:hypothetical protein [Paludibacteraceae bacterium]
METRITPHTPRLEQQHYAHPKHGRQKSLVYFESSLKRLTFEQKLNYTEVFLDRLMLAVILGAKQTH